MIELKPCPFCGGNDIIVFYYVYGDFYFASGISYFVFCNSCNARTKSFGKRDDAENAWNRRVNDGKATD